MSMRLIGHNKRLLQTGASGSTMMNVNGVVLLYSMKLKGWKNAQQNN